MPTASGVSPAAPTTLRAWMTRSNAVMHGPSQSVSS
jgi:hypothetical protein